MSVEFHERREILEWNPGFEDANEVQGAEDRRADEPGAYCTSETNGGDDAQGDQHQKNSETEIELVPTDSH
jgi:hypothetical protein